ncbi:4Fe-4S dicluster domain-containing protein [Thermosphaera chiliense]|uniref:4Fe-4S dicluster domain-containing protein n=1 Tax=Thermosphaera chiliense TaxID=3402707 RepID=A0A7M1UPC5_9CREN|nr:4Fe-4S dicluster domain-containing protein [Thermosphaera aggregans]QOR94061.1 4Fe-4S dicluster domain-containing protein [Thermosphaera aggregans]
MPIWILRDFSKCSSCKLCEIVCSLKHENMVWPEAARIRIYEIIPGLPVISLCVQCDDYPCVSSCPFQALSVGEHGEVLVDKEKCTMCGACVTACPGNIPRILPGKQGVIICNLCNGEPECVKVCSEMGYHALQLVSKPEGGVVKNYLVKPEEASTKLLVKMMGEAE